MKRRFCELCEALTNANPCKACGADTTKLPRPVQDMDDLYRYESEREAQIAEGRGYTDEQRAKI